VHFLKYITLIIPTHNRENYLKRILDFFNEYEELQIIIADSSIKKFKSTKLNKSNIIYSYTPKVGPTEKWSNILKLVKTPYVLYCADDDFISIKAIKKSLQFLENNKDYVCAQGRILTFINNSERSTFQYLFTTNSTHTNFENKNFKVTSNNPLKRLKQISSPYRHLSYSIHRYKSIYEIYLLLKNIKESILVEVALVIMSAINGKTKEFSFFYQLREYFALSGGTIDTLLSDLIKNNHPDYIQTVEIISNFLMEKVNFQITYKSSKQIVQNTFSELLTFFTTYNEYKKCYPNKGISSTSNYLNSFYTKYPELNKINSIITKYNISSGFENNTNNNFKLSISKNFNVFYNELEKIFKQINNKKIVIYGAGTISKIILSAYKNNVDYIVDKNTTLHNTIICEKTIHPINYLLNNYDYILISVLGREEEIIKNLREIGISKNILEFKLND
jgi:glycosyltransferase domain-containing protein